MDASKFDRLVQRLAARNLTRRAAVAAGGAGLAVLAHGRVAAQDATPAATSDDVAAEGSVLFVQTATGGSFVPNSASGTPEVAGTPTPGGGADYLLTLEGHHGGTIYFSDRPERAFGDAPTQRFLDGLGFFPGDPPNAALVAQTDAGEDVVVLELVTPTYDAAAGTLTYGANILTEYAGEELAYVAARQQDDVLPEQFSRASLFIDSCDSHEIVCTYCTNCVQPLSGPPRCDCTQEGTLARQGFCWHFGDICCHPCSNGSHDYWNGQCNATFASCDGKCTSSALNNACW